MAEWRSRVAGHVHVSAWSGAAIPADVARLREELLQVAGQNGGRVAMLLRNEATDGLPDADTRDRIVQMLRELGPAMSGVALVIPMEGFLGAALRSLFTGIALVLRPSFPWKMFADDESAVAWVLETGESSRAPVAHDLRASLSAVREELAREVPAAR